MGSFQLFWIVTKLQRMLFSFCWWVFMLVYFGIGLGALAVLFLIESQFFMQVTQHEILGYGIAAIFEIAKVGTSTIKQAIVIANRVSRVKVSALIRGVTVLFQITLVAVSLFCSVVVVTSYLDGSAFTSGIIPGRTSKTASKQTHREPNGQQPVVASTLMMLQNGLNLKVKPATFISVFALLISALFQGTVYIVFGHLIATQAREIEHIFEVKMHRIDAKKNCMPNT